MEDNLENNIEGEKMIIEINDLENIEKTNKMKPFLKDPYLDSNIFSRFFFGWAFYILRLAKNGKLTSNLLGNLNKKLILLYLNKIYFLYINFLKFLSINLKIIIEVD